MKELLTSHNICESCVQIKGSSFFDLQCSLSIRNITAKFPFNESVECRWVMKNSDIRPRGKDITQGHSHRWTSIEETRMLSIEWWCLSDPLTHISRARHFSTLNISEAVAKDRATLTTNRLLLWTAIQTNNWLILWLVVREIFSRQQLRSTSTFRSLVWRWHSSDFTGWLATISNQIKKSKSEFI